MATINLEKFIPKYLLNLFQGNNFRNNSYLLGQRGPIWISVTEPYDLYNRIPELRSVIDRDANMFANMQIYKRNKKSKELIDDVPLNKLLDNPNCTQSQNQFLKQYRAQLLTYGNQFIYKNTTKSAGVPNALWNISAFYLQPWLTGKLFQQNSMDEIISEYHMINTLAINDRLYFKQTFKAEEILFTKISDLNNPLIGKSPIACLQWPLSNIETAYKARNVAHQMVGTGILSPKVVKDMSGSTMPMNPKQREEMEKQFRNDYGINHDQRRTILSTTSVEFQGLAVPTQPMMLLEEVSADIVTICNVFHMNPQIFLTNTTYENLRSGIVQTYQDSIIPAAEEFMQALSPFIGLKPEEELIASFEHISILQENKLKGMAAIQAIIASLAQAIEAGMIAKDQAMTIVERELNLRAASY